MCLSERAKISITRRIVKSIILLTAIFILASTIIGAVSVESIFRNTDVNLRRKMRPVLSINRESHLVFMGYPIMTLNVVREIASLSYVAEYDYTLYYPVFSFSLHQHNHAARGQALQFGMPTMFLILGSSRPNFFQLVNGDIELVEGRTFEEYELVSSGENRSVAIISEAFAEENGLRVGDTFDLYQHVFRKVGDFVTPESFLEENVYDRITLELTVIGLYDVPIVEERHEEAYLRTDRDSLLDNIFVPNWAVEDIGIRISESHVSRQINVENLSSDEVIEHFPVSITPIFMLDDPASMENFREIALPMLPEHYDFVDLSSTFDEIESSMENLLYVADFILFASIGATTLTIGLIVTLFLRDRREEIGIYLTLGASKMNIIGQILLEVLVIALVGITLAVFAGNFISGVMTQNILRNEMVANQEQRENEWIFEGGYTILDRVGIPSPRLTPDEMIDAFDVSLDTEAIALFYGIGLSAIMLSALIPTIFIVRLNPKKVLLG